MKHFLLLALLFAATVPTRAETHEPPEQVPLRLELPRPLFVGTPVPVQLPHLEPPRTGPRPPFFVTAGVTNLALHRPVTSSDDWPLLGELEQITDGEKDGEEGFYVELGPGKQWVQIDLGASHPLYAVVVWHFHSQARVYRNVVVKLSDDPEFQEDVSIIFNNDLHNELGFGAGKDPAYVETSEGRIMDARGIKARYVRLYSSGNTTSAMNHYIEVEVYGLP